MREKTEEERGEERGRRKDTPPDNRSPPEAERESHRSSREESDGALREAGKNTCGLFWTLSQACFSEHVSLEAVHVH